MCFFFIFRPYFSLDLALISGSDYIFKVELCFFEIGQFKD